MTATVWSWVDEGLDENDTKKMLNVKVHGRRRRERGPIKNGSTTSARTLIIVYQMAGCVTLAHKLLHR